MNLNLKGFKKIAEDKHHTTLKHEDGHQLIVAHKALSAKHRKSLQKLEFAEGGEVPNPTPTESPDDGQGATPQSSIGQQLEDKNGPLEGYGAIRQGLPADPGKSAGITPTEDPLTILAGSGIANTMAKGAGAILMDEMGSAGSDIAGGAIGRIMAKLKIDPKTSPAELAKIVDAAAQQGLVTRQELNMVMQRANVPSTLARSTAPKAVMSEPVKKEVTQAGLVGRKVRGYAEGGDVELPPVPAGAMQDQTQMIPDQQPTEALPVHTPIEQSPTPQMPQQPEQQPAVLQTPEQQATQQMAEPSIIHGAQEQAAGNIGEAKAAEQLGAAQAHVEVARQSALTNAAIDFHKQVQDNLTERQAFIQDIKDGHIDPNHYMGSMDTTNKIGTAIALALGGLGSGMAGGPNQALEFINKQIDRDIEAQKANLGKKETLLGANLKQYGNIRDAYDATRQNLMDITKSKLEQAAATAQVPAAKARAQLLNGQIEQAMAPSVMQLNMRQALAKSGQAGEGLRAEDPAMYVPHVVPLERQKDVFNEIQAAQDTKRMGGAIKQAFEQAVKENTILKTGAGKLRTPASVYALHQAMQPTFKDLEGTVRQAAMDNTFKNITPSPGDSDHTIQTKRKALEGYLQSKASAPQAKAYGIDLAKFQSTTPEVSPQIKVVNGIKFMRGPNGEAIKVK